MHQRRARTLLLGRLLPAILVSCLLSVSALATQGDARNLLTHENGTRVIAFSSEYGGWEAGNMVPSLARLREKGVVIEDFVWCTADNAPFPHWVLFELKSKQWVTSFVFNNALKEEAAYPGISARQIEVWGSAESPGKLRKIAAFQLERNKTGQAVKIDPTEVRWIKFNITANWGHASWTEMNASAAYDDGSRPANFSAELKQNGKVDLYGIYFDFASANLRAESQPTLKQIVDFLSDNKSQKLVIEGHTDNIGNKNSNIALSHRRAQSVIAEIGRMGGDVSRLSAAGYGSDRPVSDNTSDVGRALNRRVTARLVN